MSLAIKYNMAKKAKGGQMCEHGKHMCEMCHGGKMADGGEVKGVHKPIHEGSGISETASHRGNANYHAKIGNAAKSGHHSLQAQEKHRDVQHEMNEMKSHDRKYMADGGMAKPKSPLEAVSRAFHNDFPLAEPKAEGSTPSPTPKPKHESEHYEELNNYAEGGEVEEMPPLNDDEDLDMIGHIMKMRAHKYSKGGQVANATPPIADGESAEYDDLVLRDDLEEHYTGANSGDELGDAEHDEENHDTVSQVMKSRKKKDKMPRPA